LKKLLADHLEILNMLKFITHRPLWVNILVGIVLALGIFFVFVLSLNWLTHHNSSKTVPQVLGKTLEEAEKILAKAGFEIEIQDSIYTDTSKPNIVLKQFPEADEIVKVNRTVYLTINRAVPPMIEMPNLKDYSFRNAEMILRNSGLKLGDTSYRSNFAKDAVLEILYNGETISAGTKIRMGSKISFILGSGVGTEEFAVPNLVGLTFGQAKALLEANGLVVGATPVLGAVEDTMSAYIAKQNPERFNDDKKIQRIRTGQTIDLWIQAEKPVTDSTDVPLPQ
jgi:beta-lactam-binding protein with PASTA domain